MPKNTLDDVYNSNNRRIGPSGYSGEGIGIKDHRVRLSPKPLAAEQILGPRENSNILYPLYSTAGLLFPYTPTISETTTVNYDMHDIVHSNQPIASYKNGGPKELQVSGLFTAQNDRESRYALAAIHYLRTVTKMFFGVGGSAADKRGTPPPVLMFNGYGTGIFHNLPVIVTSVVLEYPPDVDYVEVNMNTAIRTTKSAAMEIDGMETEEISTTTVEVFNGNENITAWVPSKFNISITLNVQNTPQRLRRFDLDDFRTGNLVKRGGWI